MRSTFHSSSTLLNNAGLWRAQVTGAATHRVTKARSHWAVPLFLRTSSIQRRRCVHLPPVPQDLPGLETKAARGADSRGTMIDDKVFDRWEPVPLSPGEGERVRGQGHNCGWMEGCQERRQNLEERRVGDNEASFVCEGNTVAFLYVTYIWECDSDVQLWKRPCVIFVFFKTFFGKI